MIHVGHLVYINCSAGNALNKALGMVSINLNANVRRCEIFPRNNTISGAGFLLHDSGYWLGSSDAQGWRTEYMRLWKYDLAMGEYSLCATAGTPPCGRFGHAGEFIEEQSTFIVFGGKDRSEEHLNDVHLLDVETETWVQPVVKGQPPAGRFRHGSCAHNGVLYCYGGCATERLADGVFMLRLSSSNIATWSKPKLVFCGMDPLRLSSFAFVRFCDAFVFCDGNGDGRRGLRMYDPKADMLSEIRPITSREFSGYGFGISAIPLKTDKAVGIFGKDGCSNYIRLSVEA